MFTLFSAIASTAYFAAFFKGVAVSVGVYTATRNIGKLTTTIKG